MAKDYYSEKKEGEREISEYNEASFQILRLHNLWESCNKLSSAGKLLGWNWALDCIWRELSPDAARIDEKFYFGEMEKINKKIMIDRNFSRRLYPILIEKEIFLRNLQDTAGKGSRRSVVDTSPI